MQACWVLATVRVVATLRVLATLRVVATVGVATGTIWWSIWPTYRMQSSRKLLMNLTR